MKKTLLVGALSLVVVVALGLVTLAYAQTPNPSTPQTPFGPGMGRGRMGPGMMGGQAGAGEYGPMHEYMQEALAEGLGVEEAELDAALAEGKTMWQFAEEKGLTIEAFQAVMLDARQQAIEKMVEDEVLTQEQADWMLNRMQGMWGQGGYGARGGCPGMGGGSFGGRGGRWSNPGSAPSTNPTSNSL
jgi:hypothetical protein